MSKVIHKVLFMYCKSLKMKLNHKLECKLLKKEINIKVCNDCPFKALKEARTRTKISARSNTLTQLERKRTSLFTADLSRCYICGKPKEHLHEVCFGKNRMNSMKYGLVIPVCSSCHRLIHRDANLQLQYKQKGQALFNQAYPNLNFVDIFHENYLR